MFCVMTEYRSYCCISFDDVNLNVLYRINAVVAVVVISIKRTMIENVFNGSKSILVEKICYSNLSFKTDQQNNYCTMNPFKSVEHLFV